MSESGTLDKDSYPFVCVPIERADLLAPEAVNLVFRLVPCGENEVLDVIQGGQLGERQSLSARMKNWEALARGNRLWVCTYWMPAGRYSMDDRLEVERRIRKMYNLPNFRIVEPLEVWQKNQGREHA